jgi:beta-alanine degradation protein BauB
MTGSRDPVESNPDHYRVVMENERVRVLDYRDRPGDRTTRTGIPTPSWSR